jgi:hypothetical protein
MQDGIAGSKDHFYVVIVSLIENEFRRALYAVTKENLQSGDTSLSGACTE